MPISLANKIAFLKKTSSYPDLSRSIETKETHHSWVFLTDQYAYKLKKDISNELHEYSTIESRHLNCLEELRLNRRLAKEIYLDVIPLVVNETGHLQLEGKGKVVDWLVKMKRIPAENMLDQSIKNRTFTLKEIDRAAAKLAKFYQNITPVDLNFDWQKARLQQDLSKSDEILSHPLLGQNHAFEGGLTSALNQFLSANKEIFVVRISDLRFVEGHGDLRPEHICLRPQALFIDCLEFNKRLRILDPVDDLAYLSLECDILGVPQVGRIFFEKYISITSDQIPVALILFYKALRALTRARLAALHLWESKYQNELKWIQKTKAYCLEAKRNIAGIQAVGNNKSLVSAVKSS